MTRLTLTGLQRCLKQKEIYPRDLFIHYPNKDDDDDDDDESHSKYCEAMFLSCNISKCFSIDCHYNKIR